SAEIFNLIVGFILKVYQGSCTGDEYRSQPRLFYPTALYINEFRISTSKTPHHRFHVDNSQPEPESCNS
ncbi:MAG: hypothetical protein AB2693_25655, partial [Candidatus Thiodiazotropha sp.]